MAGWHKRRGRPLSDSGAKARLYHAVKEANVANLIKVDLKHEEFSFTVDEDRQRYLELLDGKLLLVTNTETPAADVVAHYKSLADIERGFRVLKSDIEIGPVYHRLPERIRAHPSSTPNRLFAIFQNIYLNKISHLTLSV